MPPRARFLPFLALFLLVFGARLWLIHAYGNATPYWDQWDAEAAALLKPWREGWITPAHFWAPHAEHRILFTRLETIALTELNGQWDPVVEMAFNAALAGLVAVGLAAMLGRALPPDGRARILGVPALAALLFALPFAWENTLAGFQGQFFFLLGFSLVALAGLGLGRPGSAGWWAGALAAVAACYSMGSGFTAAGVALGWRALVLIRERRRLTDGDWVTAMVCVGVVLLGAKLRSSPPIHEVLKAENFSAWVRAFGRCLAWPRVREPAWGLLTWLPWAGLAAVWLRRPAGGARWRPGVLVLLGTWVLVQSAAMAYARGANDDPPVSRYFDLLALGAVINVLALGFLVTRVPAAWPHRREMALGVAVVWLTFLGAGVWHLTRVDFEEDMPRKHQFSLTEEANVRGYVATGDKNYLFNKPTLDIPFPNPVRLATLLDDPTLRVLLPTNLRPGAPGPVSRFVGGLAGGGGALFALGALLAAWATAQTYRRAGTSNVAVNAAARPDAGSTAHADTRPGPSPTSEIGR